MSNQSSGNNLSEQIKQQHRLLLSHHSVTQSSSPIPSAQEIEYYERAFPGSAERIFGMAEREQAHRHEREKEQQEINTRAMIVNMETAGANARAQDAANGEIRRGQWMAFILSLGYLAATVYLATEGMEIVASAMTLGGVAAIAAVFIRTRSHAAHKESKPKEESE